MGKRSNGCITCRKRKVKCDEAKPTCERCKKATYTCAGYDQPWLDETRYFNLARQRANERQEEERRSRHALMPYEAAVAQGFLPMERVVQSLRLSAFQDDICRSFVLHRLTAGPEVSKGMAWWLSPTPRVEIQSHTLVTASRAMAAAFFGRIHQQQNIIAQGSSWYVEALHHLALDLGHDVKSWAIETLGATMALNMYELVNIAPGIPGWITHAGGVGRLIQVRGPKQHQKYPERTIFLESRMLLIANGIYSCQRTFLDQQAWKNDPWEDDIEAKQPMDFLIDALADIPYFLQHLTSRRHFTGVISENQPDLKLLKTQLMKYLKNLEELHQAWGTKYPNSYWPVSPRPRPMAATKDDDINSPPPPFETILHFTNVWRAHDFCHFNIALMLALSLLEDAGEAQLVKKVLQDMFPDFPDCSVQHIADLICRSAEYILEQNGSRGYIIYTFPAAVAYLYMDKELPQARYMYEICTRNAAASGFGFGDFVLKIPTPFSMWLDGRRARIQQNSARGSAQGSPDTLSTTSSEETPTLPVRTIPRLDQ